MLSACTCTLELAHLAARQFGSATGLQGRRVCQASPVSCVGSGIHPSLSIGSDGAADAAGGWDEKS